MSEGHDMVIRRHGRRIPKGTVIFRQGEPASELYLLQEGQVQLNREAGPEELCLGMIETGEVFGEEALVGGGRATSARAVSEALVVAIDRATFGRVMQESTEVGQRIISRLTQRLREVYERLSLWLGAEEPERVARLIEELSDERIAGDGGVTEDQRRWLSWSGKPEDLLSARAGLAPERARGWVGMLQRAGLLGLGPDGRLWVARGPAWHEFVDFCTLRARFEPVGIGLLGGLLELTPSQVGALSQRVLQRHFGGKGDEPGGAPLHSPFQRYLRLKQRFEFESPQSAGEA